MNNVLHFFLKEIITKKDYQKIIVLIKLKELTINLHIIYKKNGIS